MKFEDCSNYDFYKLSLHNYGISRVPVMSKEEDNLKKYKSHFAVSNKFGYFFRTEQINVHSRG
jgi:hypothetical protein